MTFPTSAELDVDDVPTLTVKWLSRVATVGAEDAPVIIGRAENQHARIEFEHRQQSPGERP